MNFLLSCALAISVASLPWVKLHQAPEIDRPLNNQFECIEVEQYYFLPYQNKFETPRNTLICRKHIKSLWGTIESRYYRNFTKEHTRGITCPDSPAQEVPTDSEWANMDKDKLKITKYIKRCARFR